MTAISSSMNSRDTVFLYHDTGSAEVCTATTETALHRCFSGIKTERVSTKNIREGKLDAARGMALIVGGGNAFEMKATGFKEMATIQKILDFLDGGGRYFGICAGAYLAANESYEDYNLTSVQTPSRGPYSVALPPEFCRPPFSLFKFTQPAPVDGFVGAERAPNIVFWNPEAVKGVPDDEKEQFREDGANIFWCKGPAFGPDLPWGWRASARYRIEGTAIKSNGCGKSFTEETGYYELPAIIENGTFVLTGVHPEAPAEVATSSPDTHAKMLKSSDKVRDAVFKHLCEKVGIHSI